MGWPLRSAPHPSTRCCSSARPSAQHPSARPSAQHPAHISLLKSSVFWVIRYSRKDALEDLAKIQLWDSLGWKLFYVTGCLFVAVQNLEDWEEAIFDKSTGKVVLKTFSLYKKLLTLFRAGHDQVVVLLHDVRDVSVEEEKVRYFGKGYMVVLRLATGFSHPLTQSAVMGHRSDVEAVAKLITTFLELHCLGSPTELSQSSDSEAGDPGSQS
ncbi:cytochrome b-245 chaperone 1 isoform X1 [Symphalangus syndactylus]|uniref:cytochrome b-245 chaperone 1 isoform X1 n=1 Tax=Symphalangus syndactylus TaxID=9590 RepID=UPI002442F11B|nr:cytochrome b-245 chaperone 1 isoform X1 [Symphalangus syndactylus]